MNYLNVENISKSYGDKVLFEEISLLINKGDKVGLVAKNGTGKSTLLRMLAGLEVAEGEKAKIQIRSGIKVVFLDQEPYFKPGMNILDAIFDTDDLKISAIRDYEQALLTSDEDLLKKSMTQLDDLKAWDMEVKIKETLFKLKIPMLDKPVDELSGGQKKRLALSKILIQEPEFMVLDEPTNHLDLDMIEWLEKYLSQVNMTVFMVTHDRYFLENICNRIVELEGGNLYTYSGNYERYLEKKLNRAQNKNVVAEKNRKLLKSELEWLGRQPKARGTKAKARVGKVHQLKDKVADYKIPVEMTINIESRRLGGKIVEFHDLSKSFGSIKIVEHFNYKFKKNEKLGIVGGNGVGKTSFINMITGNLKEDSGKLVIGETVVFGYFTQDGIVLEKDKRVIEVIRDIAEYLPMPKGQKMSAEQLLERFLFSRKHQQVYVSQLSGGEKRRLHLLTILMKNPNFLILDEPTNDLDILTLNVLENYLMQYKGCLVLVTHDRYFMDKLVDHLFIMEGDGLIRDFNGNYTAYRNRYKKTIVNNENAVAAKVQVENQAELRKRKKKIKNEISRLERDLESLELKKAELTDFFNNSENATTDMITLKSSQIKTLDDQIDKTENRWESLVEQLDGL